jgi:hypothetical protein
MSPAETEGLRQAGERAGSVSVRRNNVSDKESSDSAIPLVEHDVTNRLCDFSNLTGSAATAESLTPFGATGHTHVQFVERWSLLACI